MRKAATFMLVVLLAATPALAQTYNGHSSDSHRALKVLIGAGAIAAGTAIAAKSSETTTISTPLGSSETSKSSTSQLVTGVVVIGVGGFLLWDGLRHRDVDDIRPSTAIGVAAAKRSGSVFVRRSW
jgi:hypothetical protein